MELLTPDYSVPETSNAILSIDRFTTIKMEPQEPRSAAGMNLPQSQPGLSKKPGGKHRKNTLPELRSKHRLPVASTGVERWD